MKTRLLDLKVPRSGAFLCLFCDEMQLQYFLKKKNPPHAAAGADQG